VGKRIGDLELVGRIGEGGMGVVERAHDHRLDRDVAVKLLTPGLLADPNARARFDRECRIAATLQHPNVVPVYDVGDDDGQTYIVMMLIDGPDLARALADSGPFDPSRAVVIIGQVAAALDTAHERDLVHRDVKPGNVLLARSGGADHAYLTDFGLARAIGEASPMSRSNVALGTLGYVAPEQLEGNAIDGRADIYSLACVTYELLTGVPPFGRSTERALITAHLTEPPPAASAARSGLPPALDAVIVRGMAKRPADRYQSAGEFAKALARARTAPVATSPPPAMTVPLPPPPAAGMATVAFTRPPTPPPPAPAPARASRTPLLAGILVIVLLLVLGGLGAVFVLGGQGTGPDETTEPSPGATPTPTSDTSGGEGLEEEIARKSVRQLQSDLLRRMRPAVCRRYTDMSDDPFEFGNARAAVLCESSTIGSDLAELALYVFPSVGQLDDYWEYRVQGLPGTFRTFETACMNGERGRTRWEHGALVCYRGPERSLDGDPRTAHIRWTDERTHTYGVIDARHRDIEALYDRWLEFRDR